MNDGIPAGQLTNGQAAWAEAQLRGRLHDERLRWDIWFAYVTGGESAGSPMHRAAVAQAYEAITGRKWERTPQDAR